MAVLDIDGDPIKNVIGGVRDFMVDIKNVGQNLTSAYKEKDYTSPEQGRDYDASVVALSEVINPDEPANTVRKIVPWGIVILGAVVLWAILGAK